MGSGQTPLKALFSDWQTSLSPTPGDLQQHDGVEGDSFLNELLRASSPLPTAVPHGAAALGGAANGGGGPLAAPQQQQEHFQHQLEQQQQQQPGQQQPQVLAGMPIGPGAGAGLLLPPLAGVPQYQQPFSLATAAPAGYAQLGGGAGLVLPELSGLQPAKSEPQASDSEAGGGGGGGGGHTSKSKRGPRPRLFKKHACQADSCSVDLATLSFYLQRNHICPDHLKAESYLVKGLPSRFCQRCGQGHPLTEFEGAKRSCRKALERHNQRRRDRQAASTATGGQSAGGTPGAEAASAAAVAAAASAAAVAAAAAGAGLQQLPAYDVQVQQVQSAGGWMGSTLQARYPAMQQPPQPQQPNGVLLESSASAPVSLRQQPVGWAAQPQQLQPHQTFHPSPLGQQQQQQAQQPQPQQQPGPAGGQEEWVMLPRAVLEQHAAHLLPMALPVAGSSTPTPAWQGQQPQAQQPTWQGQSQAAPMQAQQPTPSPQQVQQAQQQAQHPGQQQGQQADQPQMGQALALQLLPPAPQEALHEPWALLSEGTVDYLLGGDEFGGSGI